MDWGTVNPMRKRKTRRGKIVAVRTNGGIRLEHSGSLKDVGSSDPEREVIYVWRDLPGKRAMER